MTYLALLVIGIIAATSFFSFSHKKSNIEEFSKPFSYVAPLSPSGNDEVPIQGNIFNNLDPQGFYYGGSNDEQQNNDELEGKRTEAEDLQGQVSDLNDEIGRLRRNTDSYNADEFADKLRRLQNGADDLSSQASDLGVDDAASSLDDLSTGLRRLRNDVEDQPRYFYGQREDDIYSKLRQSESNADDANSNIDDFTTGLDSGE